MIAASTDALATDPFESWARDVAARAGNLDHLRTRTQLEAHEKWLSCEDMVFLLDCTRRFGKTVEGSLLTFETAHTVPKRFGRPAIIRYCAPSKLAGRTFVRPAFDWVSARVPDEMRPHFDRTDSCWRWQNGSVCYLGSAETMADADAQVGTSCDLAILDEAGKYGFGIVSHLVRSVYGPQFLTTPNGRIFIPSTPPLTPAHDLAAIRKACVESGAHICFTIDDIDHVSQSAKNTLIDEIHKTEGGETAVRRELYCEYLTDETLAIIPEMRNAVAREHNPIVVDFERPQFFDAYVSGDFGFSDLTAIGFHYLDFDRACLVQEDELIFKGASALTVGRAVMKKCRELWGAQAPRAMVADAPMQVIADMAEGTAKDERGQPTKPCVFGAATKTDADAALNALRRRVMDGTFRIHRRCRVTIDHFSNGVWNKSRTSFDRSDSHGHFDAIEQAKYAVRHVDWGRCPIPPMHGVSQQTHHVPAHILHAARGNPLVQRNRR